MTSNEKLDAVLNCLNEAYDNAHKVTTIQYEDGSTSHHASLTPIDTLDSLNLSIMLTFVKGIDSTELDLILDYLVNETKYVELVKTKDTDRPNEYRIKYSGKVFIGNGGYTGEFNRQNAENIRVENVERAQTENDERTTTLTAILAVFAVVMAVLEIIKMVIDKDKQYAAVKSDLLTVLIVFSFGISAGLIIYLIAKHLREKKE